MIERRSRLHAHRRQILLGLIVLWAMAFAATHIPAAGLPEMHLSDKRLHVIGYFGLGGAFWIALTAFRVRLSRRVGAVLLGLLVYGAMDEISQPLVNRHASLHDWLADAAGTALAVAVGLVSHVLHRLANRGR